MSRLQRIWSIVIVPVVPAFLVVTLLVLVVVMIEVTQIVVAQLVINHAAHEATRYTVTLSFDKRHCIDNDQCDSKHMIPRLQREKLEDAARLATTYDIARKVLSTRVFIPAQIIVCSTRQGFAYDPAAEQCWRHDDVGGQKDYVIVHISYDYPLGSSLGLNIGTVPLDTTYRMRVESWGNMRIQGLPPTVKPRATPTYPVRSTR